ncbi:hypothetical protein K7432_005930 [Basidiobolus ranarum]|uniref:Uncharacterized protein n=1 Tax=Basidiobolus ranarum TaxID=34480 RepID=A0ABR2W2E5_9FUNG
MIFAVSSVMPRIVSETFLLKGLLLLTIILTSINAQDQPEEPLCSDTFCDMDGSTPSIFTKEILISTQSSGPGVTGLTIGGIVGGCVAIVVVAAAAMGLLYWRFYHQRKGPGGLDKLQRDEEKGKFPRTNFSSSMYDSLDIPPMLPPIPPLAYDPEAFYALKHLRSTIHLSEELDKVGECSTHVRPSMVDTCTESIDISSSISIELGSDFEEENISPISTDTHVQLAQFEPVYDIGKSLLRIEEDVELVEVYSGSRSSRSLNMELEEMESRRLERAQSSNSAPSSPRSSSKHIRTRSLSALPAFTLHTSTPAPPVTSLQNTNGKMEGLIKKAKLPYIPAKARIASPKICR